MQHTLHQFVDRDITRVDSQVALELLPFSHIYSLVVVAYAGTWRGDKHRVMMPSWSFSTTYLTNRLNTINNDAQ